MLSIKPKKMQIRNESGEFEDFLAIGGGEVPSGESGGSKGWKTLRTVTIENEEVYEVEISDFQEEFEEFGLLLYLSTTVPAGSVHNNINSKLIVDNVPYLSGAGPRYYNIIYERGLDGMYMVSFGDGHTIIRNGGVTQSQIFTDNPQCLVQKIGKITTYFRGKTIAFPVGSKLYYFYR